MSFSIKRSQRGSSLVEALMTLPLMILIFSMTLEICAFAAAQAFMSHLAHEALICAEDQGYMSNCYPKMKSKIQQQLKWVQVRKILLSKRNHHFEVYIHFQRGLFESKKTYRSQKF